MKVAVLMGGRSGEHDISLASGREVAGALATLGHQAFELTFGRSGGARWPEGSGEVGAALGALAAWQPDVAFIAMHGPDGEDGRIQGALELLGIPYQGSGVLASATGLDKIRSKAVFRAAGLPVAEDRVVRRGEPVDWEAMANLLGLPLVLKTRVSGSSVGVDVVGDLATLRRRGDALASETEALLVERYLEGREFTGAVLENLDGTLQALPIVEIKPLTASFFDFEAKYTPGATDELCPAPIDDALATTLKALSLRAHRALGCRGYSRTDIMLDAEGAPVLLETNTLPGLTQASLLPKAAAAAGIAFPEMVQRLLAVARRAAG